MSESNKSDEIDGFVDDDRAYPQKRHYVGKWAEKVATLSDENLELCYSLASAIQLDAIITENYESFKWDKLQPIAFMLSMTIGMRRKKKRAERNTGMLCAYRKGIPRVLVRMIGDFVAENL